MRFVWWAPCARRVPAVSALMLALLAVGCNGESDGDSQPDPEPEPTADGTVDAQPEDAGPVVDAEPAPDAAPMDPCPDACQRLALCAVDECEAIGADASAGIAEACEALCAATPTVASVLNGADCATAIEFGIDRLPELFADGECVNMSVEPDPLPNDIPCPWACQDGEQCLGGYCVRDDGTCDTDYHCRPDREVCGDDGECEPAQFAACRGLNDCAEGFECRYFDPDPFADGTCIRPCGGNPDCPFGEECNVGFGNLCYPAICGQGTGNGTVYLDCTVGGNVGTCYPLTVGQAQQGQPGFCIEGGTAEVGAPCDNQAEERNPESAALRCVPGSVCFGDPDDPRNPYDMENEVGECTRLCDPRDPDATCIEGEICLDFSSADDPNTQFNEQNFLGACYRTDCDALDPEACPEEGQACRVLSAANREGRCGPAGEVPVGEACSEEDPCAGTAICGGNGREQQVCVAMCDPEAESPCPDEQYCYREDNWNVGFCLFLPEGQPQPDMGPPDEADMGPPDDPDMGPGADPDMGPPPADPDMGIEGM